MGWFGNIFGGGDKSAAAPADATAAASETSDASEAAFEPGAVPPAKKGLNGEYDPNGLAKRVTVAFDESSDVPYLEGMWVAQLGATVVLKGKAPNQETLDQLVAIASQVEGALSVDTDQVTIE